MQSIAVDYEQCLTVSNSGRATSAAVSLEAQLTSRFIANKDNGKSVLFVKQ